MGTSPHVFYLHFSTEQRPEVDHLHPREAVHHDEPLHDTEDTEAVGENHPHDEHQHHGDRPGGTGEYEPATGPEGVFQDRGDEERRHGEQEHQNSGDVLVDIAVQRPRLASNISLEGSEKDENDRADGDGQYAEAQPDRGRVQAQQLPGKVQRREPHQVKQYRQHYAPRAHGEFTDGVHQQAVGGVGELQQHSSEDEGQGYRSHHEFKYPENTAVQPVRPKPERALRGLRNYGQDPCFRGENSEGPQDLKIHE
jgi:hypothetical protein